MNSQAIEDPELAVFRSEEYADALRVLAKHRSTEPELCAAVAELNLAVSPSSQLRGVMGLEGTGFILLLLVAAPIIMFGRLLNWIAGLGLLPGIFGDLLPGQIPEFIKERLGEPPLGWEVSLWVALLGFILCLGFFIKALREIKISAKQSHDSKMKMRRKKIDVAVERVREATRRSAPKYQQPAFKCLGDFENCCKNSQMTRYVCIAALVVCHASLLKGKAE